MPDFLANMMLGSVLSTIGPMAIAAIAATLLIRVFKGRKAAVICALAGRGGPDRLAVLAQALAPESPAAWATRRRQRSSCRRQESPATEEQAEMEQRGRAGHRQSVGPAGDAGQRRGRAGRHGRRDGIAERDSSPHIAAEVPGPQRSTVWRNAGVARRDGMPRRTGICGLAGCNAGRSNGRSDPIRSGRCRGRAAIGA